VLALGVCLWLLASCGEDSGTTGGPAASSPATGTSSEPAPEPTPEQQSPSSSASRPDKGTKIVAGGSAYGPVLFDSTRQAVYVFDVETTARPRCYGACAAAWPPVLTKGSPVAGTRVRQALLGTTERRDGSTQVTYRGRPLYFYAHEGKDVVECHDIFLNGGTWYAVQPDGDRAP